MSNETRNVILSVAGVIAMVAIVLIAIRVLQDGNLPAINLPTTGSTADGVAKGVVRALMVEDLDAVRGFYAPDGQMKITDWDDVWNGADGWLRECQNVGYETIARPFNETSTNVSVVFQRPCIGYYKYGRDWQQSRTFTVRTENASGKWYLYELSVEWD